jgi:hypothetical protein
VRRAGDSAFPHALVLVGAGGLGPHPIMGLIRGCGGWEDGGEPRARSRGTAAAGSAAVPQRLRSTRARCDRTRIGDGHMWIGDMIVTTFMKNLIS